jgi:hypothetical protein
VEGRDLSQFHHLQNNLKADKDGALQVRLEDRSLTIRQSPRAERCRASI